MTTVEQKFAGLCEKHAHLIDVGVQFECGAGWADILDEMFDRIGAAMASNGQRLELRQIKEKFGTLRVHRGPVPKKQADAIDIAIVDAELKSAITCEVCGEHGHVRLDVFGWYATRCDEHATDDSAICQTSTLAQSRWRDGRLIMRTLNPVSRTIIELEITEEEWDKIVRGQAD
jgi:hypothetical protein